MESDVPHRDLIAELRNLTNEYVELKFWADEAHARGYDALLASAAFATRVYQLRHRAVQAFGRTAHILQPVEEARNVRFQLLRTSQRLNSLFDMLSANESSKKQQQVGLQIQHASLKHLLYVLDKDSPHGDCLTLHERILSVADSASAALHAWRTPEQ